jgi:hypothetical protein
MRASYAGIVRRTTFEKSELHCTHHRLPRRLVFHCNWRTRHRLGLGIVKKAILHRKNSLFYLNENGAKVGDMFMSLIHTAEIRCESLRLSHPVAAPRRRGEREPLTVDAVEPPQYT